MATQAQIDANRRNALKSTGPRSRPGKDKTRFNGLKHGLRTEQVFLPGEDPAEFEAERQGWIDDWQPQSHTCLVLCERAAAASWRLRRSVRAEAARLRELGDAAAGRFDNEQREAIARAVALFQTDPRAALERLCSHAAGLDHLIGCWGGIADVLAGGPAAWDAGHYHASLMALLGHLPDADPGHARPAGLASARLLIASDPDEEPLAEADARRAVAAILRASESERRRLRALRARLEDPSELRRRAIAVACVDSSKEAVLLHRYEMAHDPSLRATLKELRTLAKSGADLSEQPEIVKRVVRCGGCRGCADRSQFLGGSRDAYADRSQFLWTSDHADKGRTASRGTAMGRGGGLGGRIGPVESINVD